MLSKKEKKQFYPHLITRILLYLRQRRFSENEILTEDLIKKFNKSKSRISQALSFLTDHEYIERIYFQNLHNHNSRHKILLTPKGLIVAEDVLSGGLDPLEMKVLEALRLRSTNSSYSYKENNQ